MDSLASQRVGVGISPKTYGWMTLIGAVWVGEDNCILAAGETWKRRKCPLPDERLVLFGFLLLLSRFGGTIEQVWDYVVHW